MAPEKPVQDQGHAESGLSSATQRGLALLCSSSIAGVYYSQPLLVAISATFDLTGAQVGLVPMITQLAVGLGVLFLLPLGDARDNRRIVIGAIAGQSASMLLVAWSPTFEVFLLASALLGFLTIAPYLIPPYASGLTSPSARGRVTGLMVQGFILGILLARSAGGFVAAAAGWRSAYFLAAFATLLLLVAFARTMPPSAAVNRVSYRRLLASLPQLVAREPVLRSATMTQALMFGTFGSLWIALSLHIQGAAFGLTSAAVGFYGLLGLASAGAAPQCGRLIDRFGAATIARAGIALTMGAWCIFLFFSHSLGAIGLGIVLLDIGASSTHIAKQTTLFALRSENRTRIVTIYIVGQYVGGGLLAFLTGLAWAHGGWPGVCWLGLATVTLALALNSVNLLRRTSPEVDRGPRDLS
jgi:predicted MFS family arabinose efflux permease